MTMNILVMSIIIITVTFMFLSHPLSLGLILFMQTLMISIITGMMNYNFWFSYILFLIMVGGMLILFIYMTSVASNEKFKLSPKITLMVLSMAMISAPAMLTDKVFTNMCNFMYELSNQNLLSENELSLSKFLNMPTNFNLALIILYLLLTLIMVVKITSIQHGPLRQKF